MMRSVSKTRPTEEPRAAAGAAGVAVVTGGAGALGRHVVAHLLEQGHRVHVPVLAEEEGESLRLFLGPVRSEPRLHRADMTAEGDVEHFFRTVEAESGPVSLLAAILGGFTGGTLEDTTLAQWQGMWTLNATTAFLACRCVAPGMRRSRSGRIVLVGAEPAFRGGGRGLLAYSASKAAVLNLAECLARELGSDGISVNAVVPTTIDTPANRRAMPHADRSRWLDPAEIAETIGFLLSPEAGVLNGAVVPLRKG